ncbi:MAG: hypothetical protein U1E22_03005 [Coriobacteriia bacterium]|nr:hypothetical protein [Coriobacteriia bacterium]
MKAAVRTNATRIGVTMLVALLIATAAPAVATAISPTPAVGGLRVTQIAPDAHVAPKVQVAQSGISALSKVMYLKEAPLPVIAKNTARGDTTIQSVATRSLAKSSGGELAQAQSILSGLIAKYPILAGTTVTIGDARGYQAIAYYQSGRIVISKSHSASLSTILNHEVWHIIDWRDNNKIDWGENVPPK